ncbi:hypothetical protein [Priestia aryabhattai]|uniref:hypothetical protein n=1 Tax=Priestia aryabhattai TaxID=412384 RepID=UPI001C8D5468|nr:hypothetical protein [Priestia aryabhattai]MBY0214135.1 hypothetical protein [Priestia aryabhattai]
MKKQEHQLFYTWVGMMYRCYKPYHKHYKYYGAKGVKVCSKWHDFWGFIDDVDNHLLNGHLLYEKRYQLDKDINGGKVYSLENCVVTLKTKNENASRSKQQKKILVVSDKEEIEFKSLAETCQKLNIKRSTLISCLKRGNRHKKTGCIFKYL